MSVIQEFYGRIAQAFFAAQSRLVSQKGQGALEYIAIAVLIVVVVAGAFSIFGGQLSSEVRGLFDDIFG